MKLLFVSNFYPPHHLGGYELLCHEVATHLIARGHRVDVLTSIHGASHLDADEPGVHRRLRLQSDIHFYRPWQALRYFPDRRANLRAVHETLAETQPDVAVIWGMWNLSWAVAAAVEASMGSRVAYYLNNAWPMDPSPHEAYWTSTPNNARHKVFLGALQGPVSLALRDEWLPCRLRLENVAICSRATQEQLHKAGITTDHYRIIYHGIDVAVYRQAAAVRPHAVDGVPLRVVFVGSLLAQKGVHTAIEALGHLAHAEPAVPVTLDILGAGHPAYEERLHRLVEELQIGELVTFHRPILRTQLPDFLARFDVLALPSIWEEPMALISQEAMASGLVLVGTLTGGTKEILEDGENGLAFAPEDSKALAAQIQRLAEYPVLRKKLSAAGQATAEAKFAIDQTLGELESFLSEYSR